MRRTTVAIVAALLAACSSPGPTTRSGGSRETIAGVDRVAIIVMENKEYDDVIGNPEAPFINSLAREYGSSSAMFGITHPSLPNYLAMVGGDTFGINSDCTDCPIDASNLVDQFEEAGVSWKAYMGGMPEPCYGSDTDEYAVRHNPFVYFPSVTTDPERCGKVVPFTELAPDLEGKSLSEFTWISPDECSNTHDCDISAGDEFLASVVPPLLEALGPKGVLFLTYDEGSTEEGCCETASGGRIPFVVAGGAAQRGFTSDEPHSLYSLLRTVEGVFGLPFLRNAACECTSSLEEFLTT